MPDTARFLTDEEYRAVQNNVVIACTDVILYDREAGEVLSGFRQQKPQEGYWFSCGGRMARGDSPVQTAAKKLKQELGIEVGQTSLEFLTAKSTAFDERAQEPQEEGVHTFNGVVLATINPVQRRQLELTFNKEHGHAKWFPLEDIVEGNFPAALRSAISELEEREAILEHPAMIDDADIEPVDQSIPEQFLDPTEFPENGFVIPKDHVYFHLWTYRGPDRPELPYKTNIYAHKAGETVRRQDKGQDRQCLKNGGLLLASKEAAKYPPEALFTLPRPFDQDIGILVANGDSVETTTHILGKPIITKFSAKDGEGLIEEGVGLRAGLVEKAKQLQRAENGDPRYGPFEGPRHYIERLRVVKELGRGTTAAASRL
ncbi:MAG TPA: NUDIX hydrolase [Candidatus Saccharimonadia bacterium]|nr:NUDIX hydrolase [Candidatus Saccharimonadia bacterium]